MLTKADFQKAIADSIANYPSISPLYQAEDPRIIQHLDAMATMLALFSAQVETSLAEPFEKARDSTVLADAAMRGIVSKGKPARARIKIVNDNAQAFSVYSQRVLIDSNGYDWIVDTPVTVAAYSDAFVEAMQISETTIEHTVANTYPFYAINVPASNAGLHLASVAVKDSLGEYEFRERFVNTEPGERVFHVETDDRKNVWVRLGYENVVGVQPKDGDKITLDIGYSAGNIKPKAGSPMTFDYLLSPYDSFVKITFDSLLIAGNDPPDMATLRDLCRYPSVYDHSAVYLGEFDFVVRRNYPTLRFLSVWNETIEEQTRGPSIDNINTLFVACLSQSGEEAVLQDGETAIMLKEHELTPTQKAIRNTILMADNSYRVRFYTPVRYLIAAEIHAYVPTSYVAYSVKDQIVALLIEAFGEQSTHARRGMNQPLYKQIYDLLRLKIPALSPENRSDAKVYLEDSASLYHPEYWGYLTPESLTVTVDSINVTSPAWGR